MESTAQIIKPYDPAIKRRIVFTDWRFVNPGWFSWVDAEGSPHGVGESYAPDALFFRPINSPHGIRLMAQQPQRVGPLVEPERPWETKNVWILTILYENGVYRGWMACGERLCYVESKDGYTWERPNLGIYEFQGSRDTNILLDWAGNKAIFVDPSAPAKERYKLVLGDQPGGVCGAISPDGLHWTRLPTPIVEGHCDTQNIAYYDEGLKKYVLYRRLWQDGRRAIGRSESEDFRHFPPSEVILEGILPDLPPSVGLYTNCKTTIPMAPDHHLLFPTVYHREVDLGVGVMAASRDGKFWHFLPGPPVVTATPFGQWDCGWTVPSPNLIELPNGDFALAYDASNLPHKYPRGHMKSNTGYAIWPKGRIVALEALEQGEFTTLPIDTKGGRKLLINVLTERVGSILVEVDGIPGRSFAEADPIIGDQYRKVVTWKGEDYLGYEQGKPIVLRFRMKQAKLFGLDFVE